MSPKKYPQNPSPTKGRIPPIPRIIRIHLEAVCSEVTWLNHFHEVFLQFNNILQQSSVNSIESEFWRFMQWAFISELVQRVDRLTEDQWPQKNKQVYSLMALLQVAKTHSAMLNREHYVGVKPNTQEAFLRKYPQVGPHIDTFEFHQLNREFSKFIGKTKFSLSAEQIERDISSLKKIIRRITRYRNKQIAHMAVKRGRMRPPNLNELTAAIKHIKKLTRKYFALIKVGGHSLDFGHVDITEIFMHPWISNEAARTELRNLFSTRQKQS